MRLAIAGAGTRGQAIARLLAGSGHNVLLLDASADKARDAVELVGQAMDREIARWALTASEKKLFLARIQPATRPEDLGESRVDALFECTPDEPDHKQRVLRELEEILPISAAILITSTAIPSEEPARKADRPGRLLGLSIPFPRPRGCTAELVRHKETEPATVELARRVLASARISVLGTPESPASSAMRPLLSFVNEASSMIETGMGSAEEVNRAMHLTLGMDMGPLELADRLGLDRVVAGLEILHRETGIGSFAPCEGLRKLVAAGHLGSRTGQGFFRYAGDGRRMDSSPGGTA